MSPQRIWIAEVWISERIAAKLHAKHGVEPQQVRDACLFGRQTSARWQEDPERGSRLFVMGKDRDGVKLLVLLKPVDLADGIFRCVTARRLR